MYVKKIHQFLSSTKKMFTHTHTPHTHTRFVRDYPGKPVPERYRLTNSVKALKALLKRSTQKKIGSFFSGWWCILFVYIVIAAAALFYISSAADAAADAAGDASGV